MGCCFRPNSPKNTTTMTSFSLEAATLPPSQQNPETRNLRSQEILLQIPNCTVHLMDEGEAMELAWGDFTLLQISDQNVPLATVIKVGDDLQWPLTKDEPVVKLDSLHYLFSLPMKDGDPLSYGVTFPEQQGQGGGNLGLLDSFLKEHTCFSGDGATTKRSKDLDWKGFAPRIEDYNNILAKAIAGGTGQIVKGIFKCSNAYTNQIQKGGEIILTQAAEEKNGVRLASRGGDTKKSGINKSLKRVRKLSKATEKMSKSMLDIVGLATGTVMAPLVNSRPGKAFLSMVPGEVILASLDAVNRILDAAEAAEKQALSSTSSATTRMVSERFGERAGEATEDVLATAGHVAGAAWNIFKVRKALTPSSATTSGVSKNAAKNKNRYS
ncbi:hypothetical protein SLA2020_250870 [Shorea laevis]